MFKYLVKIFVLASYLSTSGAFAEGIVREDQLEGLREELGQVGARVRSSLSETSAAMSELENNSDKSGHAAKAYALLDSIEDETRTVLSSVKLNSPFMDALDDARAKVVTILRKHEREPQSAARDARIARLSTALEKLETQYVKIQGVEKTIVRLLSDHQLIRREIQLNEEVVAVENFVGSLGKLTASLDAMVNVLSEVSQSAVDTSDTAVIAQE
jgi:hypothetical protein